MDQSGMTRRVWLSLLPAAGALRLARGAEPSFERIDTHNHIHRPAPVLVAAMEKSGWRGLSICDSREIGDQTSVLPEMIAGTEKFHLESKKRWAWATTFDARGFEERGFADRVIAGLQDGFKQEAVAVKIWKNVGMGIRARSGAYLLPDDPSLFPIYEYIQKSGKTLICHLAEPNGAWEPLDSHNTELGYLKSHPEWSMYGRKEVPSKDAILTARDRIAARYPKLRMIGCHLGSNEEDLPSLAKRLDAHPNFAVDVAARVRYLAAGDREVVRQFLTKYRDRILYATDFTLGADEERSTRTLETTHDRDWNFFATSETTEQRDRKVTGLALPEAVLKQIFRENAVRWLPGILG